MSAREGDAIVEPRRERPADAQAGFQVDAQADGADPLGRPIVWLLLAAATAGWFLLVRQFGSGDVYSMIGPYGLAIVVVLCAWRPKLTLAWLRPGLRSTLVGLGVGIAMTLVTYPVFAIAVGLWPELYGHVQQLYAGARSTPLAQALGWVVVVIVAEELLFRGVWPHALSARVSTRAAFAISLALYTLAQCGTGSLLVGAMAAICGALWTLERVYLRSLWAPLLSHMIWTPTVILLVPVTDVVAA